MSITGHRKPRTTKVKPFFLKKRGVGRGGERLCAACNSSEFLVWESNANPRHSRIDFSAEIDINKVIATVDINFCQFV